MLSQINCVQRCSTFVWQLVWNKSPMNRCTYYRLLVCVFIFHNYSLKWQGWKFYDTWPEKRYNLIRSHTVCYNAYGRQSNSWSGSPNMQAGLELYWIHKTELHFHVAGHFSIYQVNHLSIAIIELMTNFQSFQNLFACATGKIRHMQYATVYWYIKNSLHTIAVWLKATLSADKSI